MEEPIGSNSYESVVYDESTVCDSSWSYERRHNRDVIVQGAAIRSSSGRTVSKS